MEQRLLVGRVKEIGLFLEETTAAPSRRRILNIYGNGGIGKSYLLDEFRRLSVNARIKFLLLDIPIFTRNPPEFCLHLLRLLRYPVQSIERMADLNLLVRLCLEEIQRVSELNKLILALDTFEEVGDMEPWLREHFIDRLAPDVLVVISGRTRLQEAWFSPERSHQICSLPLSGLDYDSVKQYLERSGIYQAEIIEQIWKRTGGHPLTLSMLVATTFAHSLQETSFTEEDIFAPIVHIWLKEVPNAHMRELVEAASVLRHFNYEALSFVIGKDIKTEHFGRLVGYSFVRQVERGWQLHELMRNAINDSLKVLDPTCFDHLRKRCIVYYYNKIKQSARTKSDAWENAEWFYYIGDKLIQSFFFQPSITFSVEPLSQSNRAEAEHYILQRHATAKESRIIHPNPETNEPAEYIMTAQDSLFGLKHIDLEELTELDRNFVKLTRNAQGTICGLSVIIPINEYTLDYLISKPLSSAYFSQLPESAINDFKVPRTSRAGYFIKTLDTYDFADPTMLQSSGITFITHMLSSGFVVASPPPHPLSFAIFKSLGSEVADVVHFDYDERTPAPIFIMDIRGNKLHEFLIKMVTSLGLVKEEELDNEREFSLTNREREVIELLMKGLSNNEIAKFLYVSEATVKRHLSNVFRKLQIKNRVQLLNKYASLQLSDTIH
ncbi:helix-turn-helix transcriptional regulator [Cohnella mopanensis]|uniref:helix-turn-helix transcriptional regulator n=1 Tax=Cohnella mopanensis TaxID=2911966 RepID=UPI001EF77B68|nr:LuxR family transcriptional regulator [Cohnella mopanensis]